MWSGDWNREARLETSGDTSRLPRKMASQSSACILWRQIGVNGVHAVVIAPVLERVEMLRKSQTYELLITEHRPGKASDGKRPALETKVLFRGIHGRLELDLSVKDKSQAGSVMPTFYSLAGEEVPIPKRFQHVIRAITAAVNCIGCPHSHFAKAAKRESRVPINAATTQSGEQDLSAADVA